MTTATHWVCEFRHEGPKLVWFHHTQALQGGFLRMIKQTLKSLMLCCSVHAGLKRMTEVPVTTFQIHFNMSVFSNHFVLS